MQERACYPALLPPLNLRIVNFDKSRAICIVRRYQRVFEVGKTALCLPYIIHFNVTEHPTSAWIAQQLVEAFPFDTAPRYLLRDRDGKYGERYRARVRSLGIDEVVISAGRPGRIHLLKGSWVPFAATV